MLFLKSDSNSKHFRFFVFYFNVSKKSPPAIKFSRVFQRSPPPSPPAILLSFEEFSNTSRLF